MKSLIAICLTVLTCAGPARADQLSPSETAKRLASTLWLAREAAALNNQTPAGSVRQLRGLLKLDWNAVVTCGEENWLSPSDPRCLIGARRIARMFYRGLLPKMDPSFTDVVQLNVSEESQARVSTAESMVRINLPYGFTSEQNADFITGVLVNRAVRKRVKLMAEFNKTLKSWTDADVMKIEFDPNVGLADRWRTLRNLMELAEEDPSLFERPSEALLIGRSFKTLFERHLQLQESVQATASIAQLRTFLTEAKANPEALIPVQESVDRLRDQIKTVGEELKTTVGIPFDCSNKSTLTLASCLRTLKRIGAYAKRVGGLRPTASLMLIASRFELEEETDLFQSVDDKENYEIFAVREGFDLGRFNLFVRDRLWLAKTP